ncbi:MAG: sensor histidine kinase [Myxococcota bacterium]
MPAGHRFAKKMVPLILATGIIIATAPPIMYAVVTWGKLHNQAIIYARHVAPRVQEAILQQPILWRYNASKILQATILHQLQDDIARVDIQDCRGNSVAASEALPPVQRLIAAMSPIGRVDVDVLGQRQAFVSIRMDPTGFWLTLLVIALMSTPLGVITGILLYILPTRVVRQQSKELFEMNRDLAQRVKEGVDKVRDLSKHLVQTQEDERQRIARDLHDGVGQAITGLQLELELALEQEPMRPQVEKAVKSCSDALQELRHVVREMRPPELESNDLPEALRAYADLFEQRTTTTTYFYCENDAPCPEQVSICLFRLLQEALTNVSRHARATEVGIRLTLKKGVAKLCVTDDGSGFDTQQTGRGSGLRGMHERCALLNGSLYLSSQPGEGTEVVFTLPLDEYKNT